MKVGTPAKATGSLAPRSIKSSVWAASARARSNDSITIAASGPAAAARAIAASIS
ncbi:MAG: hypothetical protein R6X02_32010 [Enhygromyxa sp.]